MTTRLLFNTPSRTPTNAVEWHQLMMRAILQAQRVGSPHLLRLRQATASGQIEATLRKMGILCLTDIVREFPEKI